MSDSQSTLTPMLIIGGLFFVFGFVTWLNGSLIPFLTIVCELTHLRAYFVTLAFYIAYTVMALPTSLVLRRVGYKNGLALGLLVMVVGALIFIPAASSRMYAVFLSGLFVLGTGLTLLQTAANPYLVLLGSRETAAVRISIMGLLNKGAGIVAPLVFTALVLGDVAGFDEAGLASLSDTDRQAALNELAGRLVRPYVILAAALAVLAVYIKCSPLPDPGFAAQTERSASALSVLRRPNLALGVLTLFLYMGAEVIAGDTIGLFGRELGVAHFARLTAYTMAFMLCGYALGLALIPRVISQERALAASAMLGMVLTIAVANADLSSTAVWDATLAWLGLPAIPDAVFYVAMFGLANALVWPALWPLALRGLDAAQIATGSALLIMGIAGGATLPILFGLIADASSDPRTAYWIMLPCYLFVFYYAVAGHRRDTWRRKP